MDIIKKFQDEIVDHDNTKNIVYSYTQINDFFVLHIFNKYKESINIKNKKFYKLLSNMLFDKNTETKSACFNYEHMNNDDILYSYNDSQIINRFLSIEYTFILIDKKFEPISLVALENNYIYNVCTDLNKRKNNYMSLLLGHIFRLIKKNKLFVDVNYNDLKLTIRNDNPIKKKLIKYYDKFNFKLCDSINPSNMYILMKISK